MPTQDYTISHTGTVLDPNNEGKVATAQNQVSPQRETPIISFTVPESFDSVSYVGKRDPTRFTPRTKETFDGDGATTTFGVSADIIPVTGEPEISEQPYPVVVATVGGTEVDIEAVDYAANEVTLASAPATGTGNVALFPIITEGTIKFRGKNTLDQILGPIYPWTTPMYRWHDMPQDKRGSEVNLQGSVTWDRNETVEVLMDSPHQIVWEDDAYPDAYVSTFEQDVQITF